MSAYQARVDCTQETHVCDKGRWQSCNSLLTVPAAATAEVPDTELPPYCAKPRMSTDRDPVPTAMAWNWMVATLTAEPNWEANGGRRMLLKKTLLALPRALQTKVRLEAGQSAPV